MQIYQELPLPDYAECRDTQGQEMFLNLFNIFHLFIDYSF